MRRGECKHVIFVTKLWIFSPALHALLITIGVDPKEFLNSGTMIVSTTLHICGSDYYTVQLAKLNSPNGYYPLPSTKQACYYSVATLFKTLYVQCRVRAMTFE